MSPLSFAILLFGCGDGGTQCHAVESAPVVFQTEEACIDALDATLARSDDMDFPWIEAECRKVGEIPADKRPVLAKATN